MTRIEVSRLEEARICDMCGKEIIENMNRSVYVYDQKDFCCDICLSYYKYPTREEYLKSTLEGK